MKTFIVCLFFLLVMTQAQEAVTLELGRSHRGTLDASSHINYKDGSRSAIVTLELTQGTVAWFQLKASFDSYLTLFDPDMTLVISNDESSDSDDNFDNYESAIIQNISQSGKYTLVISGYYDYSLGDYELLAQKAVVVDDSEVSLPSTFNSLLTEDDGYDSEGYYYDEFDLILESSTVATISMSSPVIDSLLKVFDEAGNLIASNDTKEFFDDPNTPNVDESLGYTTDAELKLELAAGRYTVQALSYSLGFYQLAATVEGEQAQTTPSRPTPSKPKPVGTKPGN